MANKKPLAVYDGITKELQSGDEIVVTRFEEFFDFVTNGKLDCNTTLLDIDFNNLVLNIDLGG